MAGMNKEQSRFHEAMTPTSYNDSEGPQVAPSSQPIPVQTHMEGLQLSPQTYPINGEKAAPQYQTYNPGYQPTYQDKLSPPRSKKWPWMLGAVFGILIALGAGIGIGYAVGRNASKGERLTSLGTTTQPTQTVTISVGPSGTTTATSSATSSAVTSGTTGITAFSCNSTVASSTYTTPSGEAFQEDCFTDYPGGFKKYNATSDNDLTKDIKAVLVYTFQDCMDNCADYNKQQGGTPCQAITYNADLDIIYPSNGANCFLKDARGMRVNSNPTMNYTLMASAYLQTA